MPLPILTREQIKTYLKRIGITDIQAPTMAYLIELHQAHVRKLSWQTVDIYARKPAGIDLNESVQLILNGRSGYCFHLNGAFSLLLRSLGYKITMHRAGVQPLGQEPRVNGFHLGLTVRIANEQQEEERWIVDVGLGDMPYAPIPLQFGRYEQTPLTYAVEASRVAAGGWRLVHDSQASFAGVDFDPEGVPDLEGFKSNHAFYSRSADSPWYHMFLLRQRHTTGSNELRGCIWRRREGSVMEKVELHTRSQWLEVLGDVFGEALVAYSHQERDALWNRVQAAHEDWKRLQSDQ